VNLKQKVTDIDEGSYNGMEVISLDVDKANG